MEANEVQARPWHQRSRCMNSSGDMTRCVVPSRQAVLSLSTTCPAALVCTRSLVSAGRVMVRHSCWQRLPVVSVAAHGRVQAEPVDVGAQRLLEVSVPGHRALQRQHLLPGARSEARVIDSLCGVVRH